MTKNGFTLARWVVLSGLLLTALLSIAACQLSSPTNQGASTGVLNTSQPKGQETLLAPIGTPVAVEPVLSPRQPLPLASIRKKHFVIPVARSGDLSPDKLDEYVLNIIEESRQWQSVSELQIHGHTDSEGSELSNMLLSIRRANRVAERFEELGVEAGLLLIEAHGETQAIADNTTLDGRIANRRIEIMLLGNPGRQLEEQDQYETVLAILRAQGEKP